MDSINRQLGEFLRLKREGLEPKDVGLSATKRRRTPGLRREEVAELAGISVDWYTRLEQGRNSLPSKMTVEALAKALKLTQVDRSHLSRLASGGTVRAFKRESIRAEIASLVRALPTPAYIIGARYDILCWNQAMIDMLGDVSKVPESERNLIQLMFSSPELRRLFVNWESEAREVLAGFRVSYDMWAHSPDFSNLVKKVRTVSPEFKKWWKTHSIRDKASGEKIVQHPVLGKIKVPYCTFQLSDDTDLKLVLYGQVSEL